MASAYAGVFFVFKILPAVYGNSLPLPRKLLNQLSILPAFGGNLPANYHVTW